MQGAYCSTGTESGPSWAIVQGDMGVDPMRVSEQQDKDYDDCEYELKAVSPDCLYDTSLNVNTVDDRDVKARERYRLTRKVRETAVGGSVLLHRQRESQSRQWPTYEEAEYVKQMDAKQLVARQLEAWQEQQDRYFRQQAAEQHRRFVEQGQQVTALQLQTSKQQKTVDQLMQIIAELTVNEESRARTLTDTVAKSVMDVVKENAMQLSGLANIVTSVASDVRGLHVKQAEVESRLSAIGAVGPFNSVDSSSFQSTPAPGYNTTGTGTVRTTFRR